jgi:hypothetical protein
VVNSNIKYGRLVVFLGLVLVAIFVVIITVNSTTQNTTNMRHFHHIDEQLESIFIGEFYHTKHHEFTKRRYQLKQTTYGEK